MTARTIGGTATLAPLAPEAQAVEGWSPEEWKDLDVSFVESGVAAEQLIRMTDDQCNSTCGTACTSCP
ncbi:MULTISPECIES: FxLD family lanthipeptide [Nonomuraea]|jgi:FxLD family lantipeptide|uniref:FxLD family lantipeptide n=2 Tax=Nonomuraea TaxID=83681 RepID=A0ABP6WGU3_9ACTN